MLRGKNVLLGVTGSIAAYKSTYLVRLLVQAGATVKVVLSPAARDFVTPLTLATLSKNPVLWEFYDPEDEEGKWNNHVDLALWADLVLVAPATANTLSKMVSGSCDNLLLGVYLSAKSPVYVAPAMDLDMYRHPSTKENLKKLKGMGHHIVPAGTGELASGLEGEGRMAEPEEIIAFIKDELRKDLPLSGKKVMINGGPTHEPIDPVRFVGNHSTGKMGIALAECAYRMGAEVTLILGPTHLLPTEKNIKTQHVSTAVEMEEVCKKVFEDCDLAILSAAISDYRPESVAGQKIKKSGAPLELKLVENPDVLAGLGKIKAPGQVLVGFALETDNGVENATAKLHKKNLDLIVLNSPGDQTGFRRDTNAVILIGKDGDQKELKLKSKIEIAEDILHHIVGAFMPQQPS